MVSQLEEAITRHSRRATGTSAGLAFLGLLTADVIMKLAGFKRLYRTVKWWPLAQPTADDKYTIANVCASVDRAAIYYPKQALCLQRSAVVTCLLRRKGIKAQMVIGCRKIPFKGHAWVEVDGVPVNGDENVVGFYDVLTRC